MKILRPHLGTLAFLASLTLAHSAPAQVKIGELKVTVLTAPACDQFPPVPAAVSNSVGLWQGGFYQDGSYRVGDPFSNIPALANVSPYVALNDAGSVTYVPKHPTRALLILWGTIDEENTITFYGADGSTVASIEGSDLLKAGLIQSYGGTSLYMLIHSTQEFSSVTVSEPDVTGDSFEFSDVRFAALPPACT